MTEVTALIQLELSYAVATPVHMALLMFSYNSWIPYFSQKYWKEEKKKKDLEAPVLWKNIRSLYECFECTFCCEHISLGRGNTEFLELECCLST